MNSQDGQDDGRDEQDERTDRNHHQRPEPFILPILVVILAIL
jgi:hypothetical protein